MPASRGRTANWSPITPGSATARSATGLTRSGAVVPGYSTLAAPAARGLAKLQSAIVEHDVKAVFVGLTVNPDLAERVAEDTGTQLVFLYTGSLSEPEGPAGDSISFMACNVNAIVEALR